MSLPLEQQPAPQRRVPLQGMEASSSLVASPAPAPLSFPSLAALTTVSAAGAGASGLPAAAAAPMPAAPVSAATALPLQDVDPAEALDLSMIDELSKVIDVMAYEEEANARVVAYEARLHSEATAEVRRTVEQHEGSLTERAAQEVGRTRQEVAVTLSQQSVRHDELIAETRARAAQGESQFVAEARTEMQQYAAFLVHQCEGDRHEVLRSSAAQLEKYFAVLYTQRMGAMEAHYDERFIALAAEMREQCRSELLNAEARIGVEHVAMATEMGLAEDQVARARRRADALEASERRSLELAVAKEQKHTARHEAIAEAREASLRAEMRDDVAALRQELQSAADETADAQSRAAAEAAAFRNSTQVEVDRWAAGLIADSDARLLQVKSKLQSEVVQAQSGMRILRDEVQASSQELLEVEATGQRRPPAAWPAPQAAASLAPQAPSPAQAQVLPPASWCAVLPAPAGASSHVMPAAFPLRMRPRGDAPPPTSVVPVAQLGSSAFSMAAPSVAVGPQAAANAGGQIAPFGGSSDETSGEEFTRKRTVVKPIDLGSPPDAGGYRTWLSELYGACCAASNRPQRRTIRFIRGVEACQDPNTLLQVPRKWQSLDAELFGGVLRYATGELKRALLNYREGCYRQGGPPSGRWALWQAIRKYLLQRGTATQVDLTALMNHEFRGDLSVYLDGLDAILMHLSKPPEEELLHACVEPQLRRCKALELDFKMYDRAPEGSHERTIQYLYDAARAYLARKQLQDVTESLLSRK